MPVYGGLSFDWRAQRIAGTGNNPFTRVVKGRRGKKVAVDAYSYTAAATAHNLTFMDVLASTTLVAGIAASGTSATLTRDPGNYSGNAASDGTNTPLASNENLTAVSANASFLGFKLPNGEIHITAALANATLNANGTVTVTLQTAIPASGALKGATVYYYGTPTSTNPLTGLVHPRLPMALNTTNTDNNGSIHIAPRAGDPLLIHFDNPTNNGTLNSMMGRYTV